jgi:hypothetical protein
VPTCTSDEYYSSAANQCYPCGANCLQCEDETGYCTECMQDILDTYRVRQNDLRSCELEP